VYLVPGRQAKVPDESERNAGRIPLLGKLKRRCEGVKSESKHGPVVGTIPATIKRATQVEGFLRPKKENNHYLHTARLTV